MELLKVAYNYTEQGKRVLLFTSAVDNRDGVGNISSRAGFKQEAYPISPIEDLMCKFVDVMVAENDDRDISCILVDEAQFLSKRQVESLAQIAMSGIPVIAYGLKNDFSNELFEGSEALLIHADKTKEIKTICWHKNCSSKAIMNLRLDEEGEPVHTGEQVMIGGNDRYLPVCRKHYYNYRNEEEQVLHEKTN